MNSKFLIFLCILIRSNLIISIQTLEWCNTHQMIDFVKKYLPDNPIILDAGAYDGVETMTMKEIWPNATIYAFEPVPELYNKLKRNTQGANNIHCVPLALSDKNGFSEFYLSETSFRPDVVTMSSSLLQPKDHLKYDPYTVFNKTIEVPTIKLNDYMNLYSIPKFDFLWLDMQGFELNVLKTLSNEVLDNIRVIVTEIEFVEAYKGQYLYKDITEWLENKGFQMVARNFDMPPSKEHWFGDVVFIKKSLINNK